MAAWPARRHWVGNTPENLSVSDCGNMFNVSLSNLLNIWCWKHADSDYGSCQCGTILSNGKLTRHRLLTGPGPIFVRWVDWMATWVGGGLTRHRASGQGGELTGFRSWLRGQCRAPWKGWRGADNGIAKWRWPNWKILTKWPFWLCF